MVPLSRRALIAACVIVSALWLSVAAQDPGAAGPATLGVPSALPQDGVPDILTGPVSGGGGIVRLFSGAPGHALLAAGAPFGAFTGGVRVASGDLDGDGIADLIVAQGPGGGLVRAFSGADVHEIAFGYPFGPAYAGGVNVAVADVTGDGRDDVIVAMATGPWVKAYNLVGGLAQIAAGTPYGAAFPQGIRVAAGDLNGDGRADIITAPDTGGGTVHVFDGAGPTPLVSVPFPHSTYVATGDVDGDGRIDIVLSPSASAGPIVAVTTATYALLGRVGPGVAGGISVAVADLTGDGRAEVIGGLGPASAPLVGVLDHTLQTVLRAFPVATSAPLPNGVYVAATVSRGIRFTSAATTTFTTGTPGTFTVTTSAGPTVTTITSSGALPSGVTFTDHHDGTATLSGTPAAGAGGVYTLTFTAGNGVAEPETQTFTLRVNGAPQITSSDTTTFHVAAPGTFTITTTGFPTPAVTSSGALPAGLTFTDHGDGTATLAGTPTSGSGGTYPLIVTASNGIGTAATQAFTLLVDASPAFVSAAATTFTAGTPASFAITATAEPAITSITMAGTLPAGISFTDNGGGNATLSGTAAISGTFTLTFTASNGGVGANAVQTFTLTIQEKPAITSASTATFTVGTPATFDVTTTGFPTAALSLAGTLPAGLTFVDDGDGTATLAGTPAAGAGGVYPLTVAATNSAGTTNATLTITIEEAPAITSGAAATFTVGELGTFLVTTTGVPTPALTYAGTLPAGVSFGDNGNGTASLGGTPDPGTGGTYAVTITASNSIGAPVAQSFVLTVNQPPTFTSTASATFAVGVSGTFTVDVNGFPTPTIGTTDTLPSGVTLTDNSDGTATLAGTPDPGTAGDHTVTFTAANGVGTAATQTFTLTVTEAPTITSANGVTFTVGTLGTFTVQTTGTPAPSIARGGVPSLPANVTWTDHGDGTGTLGGTPASGSGGTYALTFQATNGAGSSALQTFTLTINEAPAITSAAATSFTVGTAGTFSITTSGFPVAAISSSTLPNGVTLADHGDGTATLGGTPAGGTGGTHTITVQASNIVGSAAPQTFTLTIDEAPAITSANATTFTVGSSGSFTVQATGAPTPTITRGSAPSLPANVTWIDNGTGSGTLAGTPADGTGGTYTLTFQATNTAGTSAPQTFTLTINEAPEFTSAASASYVAGTVVNFPLTTSGHPAPDITHTSGALPTGLTYNDTTNTIEGTPTAVGTFTPQFTAANGINPNAVQNFSLEITCAPITVSSSPTTVPNGTYNVTYAGATFSQMGGGAGAWSATGLPPGLVIDGASGVLSGTPSNTGVFAGVVTYTVPGPCTGTKNISITVAPDAINDLYSPQLGNTQVVAAAHSAPGTPYFSYASSIFANDSGPAGTTVVPVTAQPTTLGGSITIAANGAFTYTPQVGDTGNDTFTYQITSNGVTDAALITINLGSQRIWWINASGSGSGLSSAPANSLSTFNGASGAGDPDDTADYFYIYPGSYGGLWIEASQRLYGAGAAFAVPNLSVAASTKPTITGTLTIAGNSVQIYGLDLSTGASTGITNSGTPLGVVIDSGVTVATTTGTAVDFNGLDASDVTGINFASVSASDPVNGIKLTNVNNRTGGGAGGVITVGPASGVAPTGGTINSASDSGVRLTSSKNIVLRRMTISNGLEDGIMGTTVANLALTNLNVSNNGDNSSAVGDRDNGIQIANLSGISSITNTTVTLSNDFNVLIDNTTGTLQLAMTGNTISQSKVESGVAIESGGNGSITVTATTNTFTASRGTHFHVTAIEDGDANVTFTNNTLTGGHADGLGQNVILHAATGLPNLYSGNVIYNISNNTINGATITAIVVDLGASGASATMTGTVAGNHIGTTGSINSCSAQGHGIMIDAHGAGTHTTMVRDNVIRQCRDLGIEVTASEGHGTFNGTFVHNDVQHANGQAGAAGSAEALLLRVGSTPTPSGGGGADSHNACVVIGGAGANANTLQSGPNATIPNQAFRARQRFLSTVRLPGYAGGSTDAAAAAAFISGNNGGAVGSATVETAGPPNGNGGGFVGGAVCPVP